MAKKKIAEKSINFFPKAKEIHGNRFDYSRVEYVHARKPVIIICKKHGEFLQTPNKHLMGQGCPHCKESNGEREIYSLLTENGFQFKAQKRFKWLGSQSLDFYIPNLNLAIEVQGVQHFEPTDFNGKGNFEAEVAFIKCLENDIKKSQLCQEHGVDLLYFCEDGNQMLEGKTFNSKDSLLSYLKKVSSFSTQRQREATMRFYHKT